MKNTINLNASIFLGMFILLVSCSKSKDATTDPSNTTAPELTTSIASGKWIVSSYSQRTEDKTNFFAGYVFTFSSTAANTGTVVAVKDNSTITGSWTHTAAVTYYGSSSSEALSLSLPGSNLTKMNKLWNVVTVTATKLTLASPEIAEDEHLVLTKQ